MTTELAIKADQTSWSPIQKAGLRQIGLTDATEGDLALFFHYAQKTGLDPFSRQIYMIGRWSKDGVKYTIQSSIDGLRIIAQRSGEYAGQTPPMWCGADGVWTDVWLADSPPVAAKVGVYRTGFAEALVAVARLDSYMPKTKDGKPSGMWGTMPDVMLAKVAESLALRKAFPNDLSGIYTTEEMEQADAKQPPVAAAKAELPYDELMKVVKQINQANSREELLAVWNAYADHIDQTWENSLGVDVSLRQFITTRNQDIQAGA
jgi:phage recombination protein Bet